ncbi:MAG: tetratricopeptide repeat protein [Deltaproteobacteria bacterium]|nr:tetratricopeptide repeat protein [Deltaproteobacteria bacterium]
MTQPVSFIKGLAHKSIEFAGSREIPRNIDIYLFRKWSVVLSALVWKIGKFGFPFGMIFPLAVVGFFLSWRKIPAPMAIFFVTYPISIILVFISGRYRIPIVPPLVILGAEGCLRAVETLHHRDWRRISTVVVAGALALLLSVMPGPFCEEQTNLEPELYWGLGATSANLGRDEAAGTYLLEAIRRKADNADALCDYGALLTRSRKYEEAIQYLNETLRIRPDFAEAYYNLGFALAKTGQFHKAIPQYQAALTLAPYDARVHNQLGLSLAAMGAMEDASQHFYESIKLKPTEDAYNNLGVLLAKTGRQQEGIPFFEAALRLNPADVEAHYNLGYAFLQLGRIDEAEAHFREVVRRNPADTSALQNLQIISGMKMRNPR